jgi:hypothetical protein
MLRLDYFYFYCYNYCLVLRKKTKQTEPKATKLNQSLRSSLLINVCPFSYKGTSIIGSPGDDQTTQLHLFRSRQTALHAFDGHNSNSPLRTGVQHVFARSSILYTRHLLSLFRTATFTRPARLRVAVLFRQSQGHPTRRAFSAKTTHHATASMKGLRGTPRDPFPSGARALSDKRDFDQSAPSAPKLCSSEPTAGKLAPPKQHTHASSNVNILIKSSLHTHDHFVHMARSWQSAPAVAGRFRRSYSPIVAPR